MAMIMRGAHYSGRGRGSNLLYGSRTDLHDIL